MESCAIGILLNCERECHTVGKVRKTGLKDFSSMDETRQHLILWRAGLEQFEPDEIGQICIYHEKSLLDYYRPSKKCCNIFFKHNKQIPNGTCEVRLEEAIKLNTKGIKTVPGHKLCKRCHMLLLEKMKEDDSSSTDPIETLQQSIMSQGSCDILLERVVIRDNSKKRVKEQLEMADQSPLELRGLRKRRKIKYGKNKEAHQSLAESVHTATDTDEDGSNYFDMAVKARDLDHLLFCLKERMQTAKKAERYAILTLKPPSWSALKTANFFQVSEHMVKQAMRLKEQKGVLVKPKPVSLKSGKRQGTQSKPSTLTTPTRIVKLGLG